MAQRDSVFSGDILMGEFRHYCLMYNLNLFLDTQLSSFTASLSHINCSWLYIEILLIDHNGLFRILSTIPNFLAVNLNLFLAEGKVLILSESLVFGDGQESLPPPCHSFAKHPHLTIFQSIML